MINELALEREILSGRPQQAQFTGFDVKREHVHTEFISMRSRSQPMLTRLTNAEALWVVDYLLWHMRNVDQHDGGICGPWVFAVFYKNDGRNARMGMGEIGGTN